VSVIEHFKGEMDTQAIKKIATLLKKGGLLLLTTPLNEGFPREFYLKARVYGEPYDGTPVFFQRHYDKNSLFARLVQPSGLRERERVFFGDYGLQAKELFMNIRWPAKPIKSLYQWAAPHLAKRFGSYSDAPVARPDMAMYTASGVFVILEKT
jgi:SAM-dependent methyltransferase